MNIHEWYDPIPFTWPKDIERIFWEKAKIWFLNDIENKSSENLEDNANNKSLTQIITTYCDWPIWLSLCSILEDHKKLQQNSIAMDENLEVYNLLINGHNGENIPPIARKVHTNWENNIDCYPFF